MDRHQHSGSSEGKSKDSLNGSRMAWQELRAQVR
eukprot:CAMPEP_0206481720 /NCGR_PEP_ID=MMETSP0324_2-20121206/38338_1 /ASSEMBLY_ACC=CAM_ASM_000836 /TAXON_ID=2866 /ORGANISM="Crypthecodinium cohnii, Strain Seligo" /LENGTH=33 /DNA_ID= /DNA_START= /DNA_END= /DNA_ORIENTATION=